VPGGKSLADTHFTSAALAIARAAQLDVVRSPNGTLLPCAYN